MRDDILHSMNLLRTIKENPSTIVLILANVVPIIQIVYFNLDTFPLIFLFWLETAIIGILYIPKVIMYYRGQVVFHLSVFLFLFTSFMFGHLIAILSLFPMRLSSGQMYYGKLEDLGIVVSGLMHYIHILQVSIIALVLSHIYSFVVNYIGNKEYKIKRDESNDPVQAAFGRVVGMHIVVFIGAALISFIGQKGIAVVMLAILKIVFDVRGHRREHDRKSDVIVA